MSSTGSSALEAARHQSTSDKPRFKSLGTTALHAGQKPDETGAVIPQICVSTTFAQRTPGEFKYEYSRTENPTRNILEANLAALEEGKHAACFSSGSAATSAVIGILDNGDHIISFDDVYGGTSRYFRRIVEHNTGIKTSFVDVRDEEAFEAAFQDNTKLVWIESPSNPTLKITDIEKACEIAHKHGVLVVVDNTFMTPYFQRPLTLGADMVVHSITKYLNGHTDVVMGCVVTSSDDLIQRLRFVQNGMGAIPSPYDCSQVIRGLKTLHLRMRQHELNAFAVAEMLEASDKVEKVKYPGLESHPDHEIAKKQCTGYGGMLTFWLKGGIEQSRQFLEALKVVTLAESLGGVESLIEHPAIMTHASIPPETRKKLGIEDNMIRFSVGCEDIDDIVADVQGALDAVKQE